MIPRAVETIGPYEEWGFGHGAIYDRPRVPGSRDRFVMSIVQARTGTAADGLPPLLQGDGCLLKPVTMWRGEEWGRALTFMPMMAVCDARRHVERAWSGALATYRRSAAVATSSHDNNFSTERDLPWQGCDRPGRPKVLVAVIDDGIPFAQSNFRDAAGHSRIEGCWVQGADADRSSDGSVAFGREFEGREIDRLLGDWPDEDVLYRAAGAIERDVTLGRSIDRTASHGSHVLDSAAGFRHGSRTAVHRAPETGDMDDIGILAVQLPSPSVVDTIGFGKDALVLSAFHYVFERADRLSRRDLPSGCHHPLIINFSFGSTGGPREGRDALERALRELVQLRRASGGVTELIMPSGNAFQRSLHGEITKEKASGNEPRFEIPWRLQPDDHTPNHLEVWLPEAVELGRSRVRLVDPGGRVLLSDQLAGEPRHSAIWGASGDQIGQLSVEDYDLGKGETRRRLVVILAPTDPDDPTLPRAASGLWHLMLEDADRVLEAGAIACRIQRDESPFAYVRGARQSYFDDPNDRPFEASGREAMTDTPIAFVRRFGSINGLATHDAATVVAGFVANDGRPVRYSGAGRRYALRAEPGTVQFSAASDTSPGLPGTAAAGTRSGMTARLDGTSVAAPRVARALARACRSLDVLSPQASVGSVARLLLGPLVVAPSGERISLPTGVGRTAVERLGAGMLASDCVAFVIEDASTVEHRTIAESPSSPGIQAATNADTKGGLN